MRHGHACAGAANFVAVATIVDEFQVNVVVLGLSTNAESPGLDAWENNADEFAEGRGVQRNNAICAASFRILGIDAVARYRGFRSFANGLQPEPD